MSRAVLQIPLDPTLRTAAEKAAIDQGFSSLQDAVRVFLKKMADGVLSVSFHEKYELTPKNEARYEKMIKNIENGKTKTYKFDNVDEAMSYFSK